MQIVNPIELIVASSNHGDFGRLQALLDNATWDLLQTAGMKQTIDALHQVPLPIVLCDEHFDGRQWRDTVRVLRRARRRTCVILLCDVVEPHMCQNVIRRGGFDILTRPLDRDQLFATLISAYSQCRMHMLPFARIERSAAPRLPLAQLVGSRG